MRPDTCATCELEGTDKRCPCQTAQRHYDAGATAERERWRKKLYAAIWRFCETSPKELLYQLNDGVEDLRQTELTPAELVLREILEAQEQP